MGRDLAAGARGGLLRLRLLPNLLSLNLWVSRRDDNSPHLLPSGGLVESIMNQGLKHAEEARLAMPCKYTASPATSRVYTELIYLPPVKETTIIIFTLHAAAPCVVHQHPPPSTAEDSIKHAAFPVKTAALSQPLSGLTDQDLLAHQSVTRKPLYTGGEGGGAAASPSGRMRK